MFETSLREAILALGVPSDGAPINGLATIKIGKRRGKVGPCTAGTGTRGGKSRGIGSGSRMRKYVAGCGQIVRAATDDLNATCNCCNTGFVLVGRPPAPIGVEMFARSLHRRGHEDRELRRIGLHLKETAVTEERGVYKVEGRKEVGKEARLPAASARYRATTKDEIRTVTQVLGLSGSEISRLLGVHGGRTVRKWIGGEAEIPYSAWRLLLIHAGLALEDPEGSELELVRTPSRAERVADRDD
jgi:DNA-binding transcriptional regulator YiaG